MLLVPEMILQLPFVLLLLADKLKFSGIPLEPGFKLPMKNPLVGGCLTGTLPAVAAGTYNFRALYISSGEVAISVL
jgi:hypothetical protein